MDNVAGPVLCLAGLSVALMVAIAKGTVVQRRITEMPPAKGEQGGGSNERKHKGAGKKKERGKKPRENVYCKEKTKIKGETSPDSRLQTPDSSKLASS